MMPIRAYFALTLAFVVFDNTYGHGTLLDPINRSSVWRLRKYDVPINYNDNENFCGGLSVSSNLSKF